MAAEDRRRQLQELEPELDIGGTLDDADLEDSVSEEEMEVSRFQALLQDRRKLFSGMLLVLLLVVAIYVLFPKIVGADEAVSNLDEATWYWVLIAIGFNVAAFGAYVALFHGVLGGTRDDEVHRRLDLRASYQITMAGLAATRIFSAAGAGGIVLTYWALRKAGMPRRRAGRRMVAFLVLTYFVYLAALVVFGVLLRTGVLPGAGPLAGPSSRRPSPAGHRAVPADRADPGRLRAADPALRPGLPARAPSAAARHGPGHARDGHPHRASPTSATRGAAPGGRRRRRLLGGQHRRSSGRASRRSAARCPFGVLVQGFFVGMAANLIPSPAGGVGAVDAGMIGAFTLFGDRRVGRVPGRADLPRDRLLAADPAGHRGVLPAAQDRCAAGSGGGALRSRR